MSAEAPATREELGHYIFAAVVNGEVPMPSNVSLAEIEDFVVANVTVGSMAELDAWAAWVPPHPLAEYYPRTSTPHEDTVQHYAHGGWRDRDIHVLWIEHVGGEPS